MTKTARVYGGSLYDLAAEEKLDGQIMEQMIAVRQIFRENPGYLKLLEMCIRDRNICCRPDTGILVNV